MKAILKHEFRAYCRSSAAYTLAGLFFLISAVYFYIDNIKGRSAELSPLYHTMGILFLFLIPVMSSRVLAEDRKTGMEVLLITSPTSVPGIVAGKFLALSAVLSVMTLSTLVFPLFLSLFTEMYPLSLLGRYIGLLLLGAAAGAFGVFISSLTENQIVVAILSFICLLSMLIATPIAAVVGGYPAKLITWFSLFSRFDELNRGVFSMNTAVYFLSFIFLFLFMAAAVIEYRRADGGERR